MKFCLYNVTTTTKQGGIETFYWEIAKELQKIDNIDVEIISGKGDYIKYDNIKLKQFDFTPREKIFDLGSRFKKWGERISFFKNSYKYLKTQKYDYFLIHKPLDFFTAYFVKKHNPFLKTIFVSGGEDFYGFDKFFSKYIDYMFSVSEENRKIISTRYNRKVEILHNGVDVDLFIKDEDIKKEYKKKFDLENKKVLISVGRIVPLKGYQLVINAIENLDNVVYIIIGNGEYMNKLKKLVDNKNLKHKVLFLGEINNSELYKYLNMGDVFLQPTISHEAFGITIVEAMSCGLPVIASYNGGMKDIIENNKNGFFFEIGNIEELKEKIKKSLNYNFIDVRQYVIEHFTWKKTINNLLDKIKVIK